METNETATKEKQSRLTAIQMGQVINLMIANKAKIENQTDAETAKLVNGKLGTDVCVSTIRKYRHELGFDKARAVGLKKQSAKLKEDIQTLAKELINLQKLYGIAVPLALEEMAR